MTAVAGGKCRASNKVSAKVVTSTDKDTLQGFVGAMTDPDSVVYTDDATDYQNIPNLHETVKNSVSEYVNGMAHTNGIEYFRSILKLAYKGTFHKISPKHLQRYVSEFAGKHNIRDSDTICQMRDTVARLVGRGLLYRDLVACNGFSNSGRYRFHAAEQSAGQLLGGRAFQMDFRVQHRNTSGHGFLLELKFRLQIFHASVSLNSVA